MAVQPSLQDFQFIVFNGSRIPDDPEVRTIIRKQAMRDVAVARKKRSDHRPVSSMQYRVLDNSTDTQKRTVRHSLGVSRESTSLASRANSRSTAHFTTGSVTKMTASREVMRLDPSSASLACVEQYETWLPFPAANPTNGYEALRAKYHFDITDLCLLTSFHVGQGTMSAMARDSSLLGTLLGKQMSSYLSFVPSRYGHKPYLTAVVDCLITKAHGTLHPHNAGISATMIRMYGKALRAVQEAIGDGEASRDADLLCAVQMLSFYEVCRRYNLNGRGVILTVTAEDSGAGTNISIRVPH
jgi:hypothetical protein